MFRKKVFWLSVLIWGGLGAVAQDMHFSQAFNFPLLINPAYSGSFNGSSRAIVSFRNQNIVVPNSSFSGVYNTLAASFESKIFKEYTGDHTLSVGVMGVSDYAGSGTLATNDLMGNINYKIALDRYGRSSLSAAIQGGITSKRIFSNDLLFEAQAGEFEFDPALPNLEKYLDGSSQTNATFGIGTLYHQAFSDMAIGQLGFSLYNITSPKDVFQTNSLSSSYSRINIQAGVAFDIDESMTFFPSILYMKQGPSNQINLGMSFQKFLNDDFKLIGGVRSRIGDAFIVMAGFNYLDFQTTFSYDFTVSTLSKINKSVGAIELNIAYIFGPKDESNNSSKQYCPNI